MADRETRRLSFGSVTTDYDRYRPAPPPQALDWLIPSGARAVLDLVVSAAWHWLDPALAVPEITRSCVPAAGWA